jgi:hypothetical protein
MSSAFISYARENITSVRQMVRELAAEGVEAWFDESLEPGEVWQSELETQIRECDFFIFCLSAALEKRQTSFAYKELEFALKHKRALDPENAWLVPVRFDSCAVPSIRLNDGLELSSLHAIALQPDTVEWSENVSRLLRRIQPGFTVRPMLIRVPPHAVHPVTDGMPPFWIGKYPVTQHEWVQVMDSNPSRFRGDRNRPVENVSWNDANNFIDKLNTNTKRKFRLPTEREWICACLAGGAGQYGVPLNELEDYAWISIYEGRRKETRPVDERKPNAWGIHDMLGNVCEWVSETISTGPRTAYSYGRTARSKGGSFDGGLKHCGVSKGSTLDIDLRYYNLGFRLAADDDGAMRAA